MQLQLILVKNLTTNKLENKYINSEFVRLLINKNREYTDDSGDILIKPSDEELETYNLQKQKAEELRQIEQQREMLAKVKSAKFQELNIVYKSSQSLTINTTDTSGNQVSFDILALENVNGGNLTELRNQAYDSNIFNIDSYLLWENTTGTYSALFTPLELKTIYLYIKNFSQTRYAGLKTKLANQISLATTEEEINNFNLNVFPASETLDLDGLINRVDIFSKTPY